MVYGSRRTRQLFALFFGIALIALLLFLLAPTLVTFALGSWVSAQTGRTLSIDKAAITWGRTTTLELRGAKLENIGWGGAPWMASVDRLRVTLPLAQLLRGHAVFSNVELQGLALLLETRSGEGNWQFQRPQPFIEWQRGGMPAIESLQAQNITIRLHDFAREGDITGAIAGVTGTITPERWLLTGAGELDHKPFTFDLRNDGPIINLSLLLGDTTTFVRGPSRSGEYDLHAQGADLRQAFPAIPIPFPSTPAYVFDARLSREHGVAHLRDLHGFLGATDLQGELAITLDSLPTVSGALHSRTLHLADLKGFIGIPVRGPPPQPGKIFPSNPINRQRFYRLHLQLDYNASDVTGGRLPLQGVHTHVVIEDGVLTFAPLQVQIAKGASNGTAQLDVRDATPQGALELDLSNLQLHQLVKRMPFLDASHGLLRGKIQLRGEGDSLADLFGNSHGQMVVLMTEGALERAFIDGLKGDIVRYFSEKGGKRTTRLDCAVAVFNVEGGVARADALVIETASTLIIGRGAIDFDKEHLDLTLVANPKTSETLLGPSPLFLTGSFAKPEANVDITPAAERAMAAIALGLLAGPLGAVAPLVQEGSAEQHACGSLLERIAPSETDR